MNICSFVRQCNKLNLRSECVTLIEFKKSMCYIDGQKKNILLVFAAGMPRTALQEDAVNGNMVSVLCLCVHKNATFLT
jgi:hypothetical protein